MPTERDRRIYIQMRGAFFGWAETHQQKLEIRQGKCPHVLPFSSLC
jgi:hypothetical protein